MTKSGTRFRPVGVIAGAGALSLALGGVAMVTAQSATAQTHQIDESSNGIIKIDGEVLDDKPTKISPHKGCDFVVTFFNYRSGEFVKADVAFAANELLEVDGDRRVYIGGDPALGEADLDGRERYKLKLGKLKEPTAGYLVTVKVDAIGSAGSDSKTRRYLVKDCDCVPPGPTSPPSTPASEPPSPTPPTGTPSMPATPSQPSTPATPSEPSTPATPAQPSTPATPTQPSSSPTVPSASPSEPTVDESVPEVPTEVDAGVANSSPGQARRGSLNAVGIGLAAAGSALLAIGAAVALRRRGKHSV